MSGEPKDTLEVHVKYRDMEAKFSGSSDDVLKSFFAFIREVIPTYDLFSKLTLTVDFERLLEGIKGLIVFTPEGVAITVPREKMGGEKDAIILQLIKAYVGYKAGKTEKETLTASEIASLTSGKIGTVGARLSELSNAGWVERVGRGEYRITTLGINAFLDEILPRIRSED
ncbi:MAG: hypothetical protein RMJ07_04180 [Nitrososphaerota archaeon]|nr:hypothetical protein [Candidatus Bathyarchaeota archaeon]MDW8048862.1 hypothetical protein [Nitrososphaerota archaeon]